MFAIRTAIALLLAVPLLRATASAAPAYELLCSFTAAGPYQPATGLIAGPSGTLLGATSDGPNRRGVVYRLPPLGAGTGAGTGACPTQTLYAFGAAYMGTGPGTPVNDLAAGRSGAFYGTTFYGPSVGGYPTGSGSVYRLMPPASGATQWTFTDLHNFGGKGGANPVAPVIEDSHGRLYGTTFNGIGTSLNGVVYRLSQPPTGQTTWGYEEIYRFNGADGSDPVGGLLGRTVDGVFSLFGTTYIGGLTNQGAYGVAFRLTPPASGRGLWTYTLLHTFTGDAQGGGILGGLIADRSLRLYGTANAIYDGGNTVGVVFRLTPPASGAGEWTYDVLYRFRADLGEGFPDAPLVEDDQSVLYGTSEGTAFKLTPRDQGGLALPWNRQVLHDFHAAGEGFPVGGLTPRREADGSIAFYGVTSTGGSANVGTVFRVRPARPAVFPDLH